MHGLLAKSCSHGKKMEKLLVQWFEKDEVMHMAVVASRVMSTTDGNAVFSIQASNRVSFVQREPDKMAWGFISLTMGKKMELDERG